MDVNLLLGLISPVATVLGIVSLAFAVYVHKRSKLEKKLVCDSLPSVPVADVIPGESGYSLRVLYESPTGPPVFVERAFLQYLIFTNFGRSAITSGDLASQDPLRIEAAGGNVLDISLASVTRDVCQIRLREMTLQEPVKRGDEELTSAVIQFEFLDHRDGGLIQVLTDSDACEVSLRGTVIGMPEGITRAKAGQPYRQPRGLECGVFVTLQILAVISVPYLYYYIMGSWENILLLLLPLSAMVIPFGLFLLVEFVLLGRREEFKFPELLSPSGWYTERRFMYERMPPSRRMTEMDLDERRAQD